jgi:hypothetical protein
VGREREMNNENETTGKIEEENVRKVVFRLAPPASKLLAEGWRKSFGRHASAQTISISDSSPPFSLSPLLTTTLCCNKNLVQIGFPTLGWQLPSLAQNEERIS